MSRLRRLATLILATALLLVGGAGVAWAHVTVNPDSVTAGSYAKLTFRVPTESDTASTVSVQVSMPKDHPFPSVSVMQLPGWTAKVTKTPLNPPVSEGRFTLDEAVTSITWTADDGIGIKPGEFMEFPLSVGPVPDVASMEFPADQTYSDGPAVRWDGPQTAGGAEPQHPAPLLTITPASGPTAATTGPTVTGISDASQPAATVGASDGTARVLAVIALVLAALALVVATFGLRRPPRSGRPS